MSEPFVAEVRIFAGNFAPRGWAFCNGQLLPIAQNTALFSLVGTTYGGDGRTTMGLPNLQDRAAMHAGNGPGLTQRRLGQTGGADEVTLTEAQMPAHAHSLRGSTDRGELRAPTGRALARAVNYGPTANVDMADEALAETGGAQPHNNRQPYLAVNFIIALVGLYPSRS